MNITKKSTNVIIEFSPEEYCLAKCKDEMLGDYALHFLIDRSDKGKDYDLGMEVLYLSEKQAEVFKQAGFREYFLP